jgi:ABC-type spermidine/putrescine transport system permease subunit II
MAVISATTVGFGELPQMAEVPHARGVVAVVILLPIAWMVLGSFKPSSQVTAYPPRLFFSPTLDNYRQLFETTPFARYTWNSLVVTTGSTLIGLLLGVPAAFAVSWTRITWPATVTLLARMAPGTLFLLPWYMVFRELGMIGSYGALVLTHAVITMPIVIWVLLPFFDGIPRSVLESAQVDGCSVPRILWRIALPLVMPGLVVAAILARLEQPDAAAAFDDAAPETVADVTGQVAELERRLEAGQPLQVESVASVFMSRWDKAVADVVPDNLRNRLALAVGLDVYRAYREVLDSERWQRLDTETFANVARIESDDAGTKMRGGDCGWIARKGRDLPEPVLEAAWALPQGGVSDVVRAKDGCYLVKTLGIEPTLDDDAIIGRMRESLVEEFTINLMKRADIRRADGKRLDGDDPTEAGK